MMDRFNPSDIKGDLLLNSTKDMTVLYRLIAREIFGA